PSPVSRPVVATEEGEPLRDGQPRLPRLGRERVALRETAPRIVEQPPEGSGGDKAGADGIEVDVVEERPQVQIAVALPRFDEHGLVAVAEEPPPFAMARVEASRVGVLEPAHALDEIGGRSLDEEVVVV